MSDLQNLSKENNYKRIRNKNSYMEAFLERRKQAADFALKGKNKSGYKYIKPNFYIHERKEIYNSKNKYTYELNSNENNDKNKFYKTYSTYNNTLKKNNKGGNRSANNMISMETENNQYYFSDGLQKSCKNSNFRKMNGHYIPYYKYKNNQTNNNRLKNIGNYFEKSNEEYQELLDGLLTNEEIDQKYKNIGYHSINFSSKNKNNNIKRYINIKDSPQNEVFLKTDKNEFWGNHNNKRTRRINYNKKNVESSPNIKANFINNIQYLSTPNDIDKNKNMKYKSKSNNKINCNINLISSKKEKESKRNINSDNNIYYEGIDNHRFYDSNKMNDDKYSCETYKLKDRTQNKNRGLYSKNYSDPQNLKENKNLYKVKTSYGNNKKSRIEKNQISDISPIRTYYRYNYEDYNDFKNIEKIYESQSIYGNSGNNSNKKSINNIRSPNDFSSEKKHLNTENNNSKNIRTRSLDLLKMYSPKVIKDTGNTKAISTVYNSQKIPNINLDENNIKIIEYSNNKNENNYKGINSANNNKYGKDLLKEDKTKLKRSLSPKNANKSPEKLKTNNIVENYNNISNKKSNKDKNNEIYFKKIENNHIKNQLKNDIINDNIDIKVQNYNNNDYEETENITEHDNSKDKYDSFLQQKDEKEPNIQSKIINSMMTSKEESYFSNSNNNLIKNIQDKIKILKNNMNKGKNDDLNKNYINEIDNYFNKIKQKEEKNNSVLNEFYQELTINNNTKKNNQETDNILDNNKLKKGKTKKNKNMLIQKSHRLQNMMKQILDNQKYKNYGKKNHKINQKIGYDKFSPSKKYNPKNEKKNLDLNELYIKNPFNDIKLSKYNHTSAPNINLIAEEGNYENSKIMKENEYFKLKKRDIKSERPNLTIKPLKSDKIYCYRNKFDLYENYNFGNKRFTSKFGDKLNIYSPRIILSNINNKIMPPNEI